jgi:ABC-2 type transport system ATP-binding protein
VKKLSDEDRELDYRLRSSDPEAAREVAAGTPGVTILEGHDAAARPDSDVVVVRARVAAVDELVARMVRGDLAVRELAPVVSPLEAAFLALTEQHAPTEPEADR